MSDIRTNCSAEKLLAFSKRHYTYINQVFGDATVREIIQDSYPTAWKFKVAKAGRDFDNSYHHTVIDQETGDIVCSVMDEQQDLYKNINDTLCQSYSLLNYFEIPISNDKKEKQMAMIQMYRDIINDNQEGFYQYYEPEEKKKGKKPKFNFQKTINDEILTNPDNKELWKDFTVAEEVKKGKTGKKVEKVIHYVQMNKKKFFDNIKETLDEWEEYGYWFFIGKGECPTHATYSSEMQSQHVRSLDLEEKRGEEYEREEMGQHEKPKKPEQPYTRFTRRTSGLGKKRSLRIKPVANKMNKKSKRNQKKK